MSFRLIQALPSVAYADRRELLPNAPGLYFAVRDGEEVVYVGMSTKSIRGRWKASFHDGDCKITRSGMRSRIRIAYLVYQDTSGLAEDEKAAIREFYPIFNHRHVRGAHERMLRMQAERSAWPPYHVMAEAAAD